MDISTEDIIWLLKRPFPKDAIHWRIGSTNKDKTRGIALAYVDSRDVMRRLDDVVGPENWQARYPWSEGGKIVCEIGLRLDGEWVWKANGAGDTQFEADKGAFSDAFKRAAVLWGVARYLYYLPNEWVEIEQAGRSYRIKGNPPELPDWALPNEWKSLQERTKWHTAMSRAWADKDAEGLKGLVDDLTNEQYLDIWRSFNSTQRREMKELIESAQRATA